MGYLSSCKAESSISVSNSHHPSPKPPPHPHLHPLQHFLYKDLQLATDNFSPTKLLGRGSHGLVYKALLPSGLLVAVKKPSHPNPNPSPSPSEFHNEIHILSHLHHPRFVNLLGFTSDDDPSSLLVVEYMPNGTLFDLLHTSPKPPSWPRRLLLSLHTASALLALHSQSPPVIHRDVKSANVLLDRHSHARLADFGLALPSHSRLLLSTPPAGTMGYLDPSYVTPDSLSTKTDVFSFGILLLEIISGRKAIDVAHSPPSILDWAIPLIRSGRLLDVFDPRIPPPRDPAVRRELAVIAAKCVRSCRERRPSMREVVEGLGVLVKRVPLSSWNELVANPCLMVEDVVVGRPVESGGSSRLRFECGNVGDVEFSSKVARPVRNSKRVYSDLGFRSNLKDLMDEVEEGVGRKANPASCGSSFRASSERFVGRGGTYGSSVLQLRGATTRKDA